MPDPITIRKAIRTYRGGFYKALLNAHESGSYLDLCVAYLTGDNDHQAAMCEALPGIHNVTQAIVQQWPDSVAACLERAFPGLKALDEETEIPTVFDLLQEQPTGGKEHERADGDKHKGVAVAGPPE